MDISIIRSVLYPPPLSLLLNALSVVNVASLVTLGILEIKGTHLAYSKFLNRAAQNTVMLSGRVGMLLIYTPALIVAVASFYAPEMKSAPRGLLLTAALSVHFFKRVFEVSLVHKYSGTMRLDISVFLSFSYVMFIVGMIYCQYLSQNLPEPRINLTFVGTVLFLIGISGNFYHHYLLSKLREKGDKAYKIPKGGLFDLVICPHYLFEDIGFFGISLISQTIYPLSFAFGSMFYLMGRSVATRKWYMSKFDNFPTGVKAFIPYIL